MSRSYLVAAFAFLLLAHAPAQDGRPKQGQLAPPISISKTYQAPPDFVPKLEALEGEVVVLEFWATWCAPCIGAMPHLNELAAKFENRVRFLAISNEGPAPVEKFLPRGLLKTWVALDEDNKTFRAYGIESIPTTVVIDREGKIALVTHPTALSAEILENVLQGRPVPTAPEPPQRSVAAEVTTPPLYVLEIRRAEQMGNLSMNPSQGFFKAGGMELPLLLINALQSSKARLILETELPEGFFSIDALLPTRKGAAMHEELRKALEATLGIEISRERRSLPVYLMTAPEGLKGIDKAAGSGSSQSSGPNSLSARGARLSGLASSLESRLSRVVVDQTGIDGTFDWLFTFKEGDPASLLEELARHGLHLQEATREVDVVVVRPAK